MEAEKLFDYIARSLALKDIELMTVTGLWYRVHSEGDTICVNRALEHSPSCNLNRQRRISKRIFMATYPYYERWERGEPGILQEVGKFTVQSSYIFPLIEKFKEAMDF